MFEYFISSFEKQIINHARETIANGEKFDRQTTHYTWSILIYFYWNRLHEYAIRFVCGYTVMALVRYFEFPSELMTFSI